MTVHAIQSPNADRFILTICVFCAFGGRDFPSIEKQLLAAFLSSIRRVYGGSAKIILLTDATLQADLYEKVFSEVRVVRVDREKLLLSRALAYSSVISEHDWSTPLAFLDYDVLVLRQINDVFNYGDDVFVTDRPYSREMPINGGVIFLNNRNPLSSSAFYNTVVEIYKSLPWEQLAWWGDQIALSRAVYAHAVSISSDRVVSSSWRVRILPRACYNYTPYDIDSGLDIPRTLSDDVLATVRCTAKIAHFKGPRKHLMLELAQRLPLDAAQ